MPSQSFFFFLTAAAAWAVPVIASINPTSGLPFTQVTVSGSGFGASAGTVTFNGVAGSIVSWSDTVIVVTAPSGSAGSGPIIVNRQSNGVTFSFIPTIKTVSPQNVAAGQTISIAGQNFGTTAGTVTLNGQQVQIVSWLATNIKFVVPANVPTGANPVVVTNSVGSSPASTLNVQFAPLVSGISPTFGPPNTQVTVAGTGFGQNTPGKVSFNGVAGTIISWSDTQIVVNAPSGSGGSGPVVVSWQGVNSNSFVFNFLPTIFNLSPSTVSVGWNFAVVGQNFGASPGTVTLNGVPLTPSAWGTNSVHLAVTSSMCTGPIVVTTAIGASNSATLTVQGTTCGATPPTIVASAAPPANATGWNNADVTVTFTCTAGSNPIQSCTSPVTVNSETSGQVVSGTATDTAGSTATTSLTVKLDKTPPALSVTSPANGATVTSSALTITGNVSDTLSGVASVTCNGTVATIQAGTYSCSVSLTPGNNTIAVLAVDVAGNTTTQSVNITYSAGPSIAGFNPPSAAVGTLITVSGSGFEPAGSSPQVTLNQQGGGTILAPISSASDTSLSFIVPSGAATGLLTVTSNGQSASSATPLTIVADSSFSLIVGPSSATLLPGQTTAIQISLASGDGFSQLAALSVSGLPPGVTANFQPSQITAGHFSILTLSAPATQAGSSSTLTITASATVQGIQQTQSANASLTVSGVGGGTSFIGRVAVTGSQNTPLVGVTVSFTGKNYTGALTGCTGSAVTDAAGNFALTGLSDSCSGAQMIQYDPSTVSSPAGKYSGVTLSYVLNPGQVTTPGIIVHLPRVDTAETFQIQQNAPNDQTFQSKSVAGISITIYAGTVFTLPDGSQPDPFPLSIVEIPYAELPEKMPPDPTQDPVYAMSIEPDNSSSSQPIAVSYPNRSRTAPGTNMPLTSLDPTLGMMVNYGTGTVSDDGTQVVPDPDPSRPGHLFGISHFDWFFQLPPPKKGKAPCPNGQKCTHGGDPVDLASGLLVVKKTDLAFGGTRGRIEITRTMQTNAVDVGPFGAGSFGHGGYDNYDYALSFVLNTASLIMPDGNQLLFSLQNDSTYADSNDPIVSGAIISNSSTPGITNLRWKDGTIFQFQQYANTNLISYLISITDPNGNTIRFTRDNLGSLQQITDPVGRIVNVQTDAGIITSITDPLGRRVQYSYFQDRLATVTDASGGVTSYGYDAQGNMISITDPRGITYLKNTYDQNGRVIKQVAADGGVTTFAYTLLNPAASTSSVQTTVVTDPLGNTTTYDFNPQGATLDMTDALGQKTTYNVDPNTNRTSSSTDSLGRITAYTYDTNGNTTSVTRLAGTAGAATTIFTYDPVFNKVTSITDPLGHITKLTYDSATGNLLNVVDATNQQATFTYDSFGEMASSTDPLGNTTNFTYLNGNLATSTDPLHRATTRTSDIVGHLISSTDPSGFTRQYQYTPLNEIAQITDAVGNRIIFDYDPNGNLLSVVDPSQHSVVYTYNSKDQIATSTDALGRSETYSYDLDGNFTQFTDRRGKSISYEYDPLNREVFVAFGPGESSMTYSYDAVGRIQSVKDSIGGTVIRAYNGLDRLVTETTSQGKVIYSYDLAGRRIGMQASGQAPTTYQYDDDNRATSISQGSAVVSLTYDPDGRRSLLTLPNGVEVSYSYDAASQLSGINYKFGNTLLGNLSYEYDASSRRTVIGGTLAKTGIAQAVSSATYNPVNQPTQFGSSSYTYDSDGNLTSDGINAYTWDVRNRLVAITGGVSANFQYDAFDRRISKTIGNATTNYLYDGMNSVQELSAGNPIANFLVGLNLDEYFQLSDASGSASFLADALGNTIALSNPGGSIQTQYVYEPFGNTTIIGNSTNSHQFTGRENDNTGLYFYRSRYYSPALQRFISQDPISFFGGSTNLYLYASGNPLSFTDATGRCPICVVGIIGGVVGGTAAGIEGYRNGARGWDLAADIAGGTGGGILAGLTGGAVGFYVADSVGPVVGYGLTGQAIGGGAGGAAGGAVGNTVDQAISAGVCGRQFNAGDVVTSAAQGAATGTAGVLFGGTVQGGWNFDPVNSPRTFGPKAAQLYRQTAIAGGLDATIDVVSGRKDDGCQ